MARAWSTSDEGGPHGTLDALLVELDNGKIFNVAWLRHNCNDRDLAHALKCLLHIVENGTTDGLPVIVKQKAA